MILQVTFDDKFVDYVVEQFRSYSSMCRIVLLTYDSNSIKYSTKIDKENSITYNSNEYYDLLASLSNYKAVIMHGLFDKMQYEIVLKLPNNVKLAWVLWGSEIYSRKENKKKYLAKCTKFIYTIRESLKRETKNNKFNNEDVPLEILKRVDYLLGSSLELFNDVKIYLKESVGHLKYSYYTIEEVLGNELFSKLAYGENILVGNSSVIENNHLDIISRLYKVNIPKRINYYFPLSYGDVWVRNFINYIGKFFFTSQFKPLLTFMQRNKYNEIMLSCGVYISNHYRPNAFGNILTALWLGLRVFVSEKNIQTNFLLNLGLHINIIERDLKNEGDLLKKMNCDEINHNRQILERNYGRIQMDVNIKKIINTLCNE